MNNMNNREKPPVQWGSVMIRMSAVLLVLTMISIHMMSGLYARYVSRGQGADSARVAAFDVKVTGPQDVNCEVTALHPGELMLTIDNDSEVAVSYSVRVEIHESAGCGVLVVLDKDNAKRLEFEAHQNAIKDFPNVGYLSVGADAATHTLYVEPLDWTKITAAVEGTSKLLTQSITVYVDVVQVD